MEKILKSVAEKISAMNVRNSTAAFGWIRDDGKVRYYHCGACHASLAYYLNDQKNYPTSSWQSDEEIVPLNEKNLFALYQVIPKFKPQLADHKDQEDKILTTFVDWLFNFSPWNEAYLDKDVEYSVKNKITFHTPDAPSPIVGMSMSCQRVINEHPKIITTWYELVKGGVHPTVAFSVSHKIYLDSQRNFYKHNPVHTGCYDSNSSDRDVFNFVTNDRHFQNNAEISYRERSNWVTSTFHVWRGVNKKFPELKIISSLGDVLTKSVKGDVVTTNVNPFAKAVVQERKGVVTAPFDKAMPLLVDHLNQYKEYIK